MITLEIEEQPWHYFDPRRLLQWRFSAPDASGYVAIYATDDGGQRQRVGQPMRPAEAEALMTAFNEQLSESN